MKKLLAVAVMILLFPYLSVAESAKEWREVCEGYSKLAGTIINKYIN